MLSAIWTSPDTAEVFFLIAVIVFGILAVVEALREPVLALLPAGLCLTALAFLAL